MSKILLQGKSINPVEIMKQFKDCKFFNRIFKKVNIISVENGKLTAELKVDKEHTNEMGVLHGGFATSFVDVMSSYALAGKGYVKYVSVDIHTRFLKEACLGDQLVLDAEVVKVDKSLALSEISIKNKDTGDILIKASHTKFILND